MGVQPEEDYVLSSVLVSQYWKHILGLIDCFAELEQWSLPLMANWGGIWLPHAASKAWLTGTLQCLGLPFYSMFLPACMLAISLRLLSPNADCVSLKLLVQVSTVRLQSPADTLWKPFFFFFFNSVGLYVFCDWTQMFHGIRQCFHQLKKF